MSLMVRSASDSERVSNHEPKYLFDLSSPRRRGRRRATAFTRHRRACPGDLDNQRTALAIEMPGTRPGMTRKNILLPPHSCHLLGLYSYRSRSSPRGVSRALEARSGNAVGRSLRDARVKLRRLKSPGSGEPAACHKGLPLAVSCVRVPTRNGETEQVRQRRIVR